MHKKFKVAFIGESTVGKSSIVLRLCQNKFYEHSQTTIGASFSTYQVKFIDGDGEKEVFYQIWDTAGQERYNSLVPIYLRDTNLTMIVFDLTNLYSFEMAKNKWIEIYKQHILYNSSICCLIGNKADLVDSIVISKKQINEFIESNDFTIHYYETSAKTGENIDKCFKELATLLYSMDSLFKNNNVAIKNTFTDDHNENKSCCIIM